MEERLIGFRTCPRLSVSTMLAFDSGARTVGFMANPMRFRHRSMLPRGSATNFS
jgi:hypothetical protein